MTYAVVVAMPSEDQREPISGFGSAYISFSDAANKSTGIIGTSQRPISDLWLLALPNETAALAAIVNAAQKYQIPHRVLYFDSQPSEYSYVPPSSKP
jgi:hypothetical protein